MERTISSLPTLISSNLGFTEYTLSSTHTHMQRKGGKRWMREEIHSEPLV